MMQCGRAWGADTGVCEIVPILGGWYLARAEGTRESCIGEIDELRLGDGDSRLRLR